MEAAKLRGITRRFNRYRFPECRARVIKNGGNSLVVEFDGTANFFCCFDEHFEDYRIMLKDHGEEFKIEEVKEKGGKFMVRYKKSTASP